MFQQDYRSAACNFLELFASCFLSASTCLATSSSSLLATSIAVAAFRAALCAVPSSRPTAPPIFTAASFHLSFFDMISSLPGTMADFPHVWQAKFLLQIGRRKSERRKGLNGVAGCGKTTLLYHSERSEESLFDVSQTHREILRRKARLRMTRKCFFRSLLERL